MMPDTDPDIDPPLDPDERGELESLRRHFETIDGAGDRAELEELRERVAGPPSDPPGAP